MKIGVILLAYNTSKYVDECLSSWVKLKSKYDITIGCVNGMFKEYIELGIKPEKDKLNPGNIFLLGIFFII